MTVGTSSLTQKGQVTLPKKVRDFLGVKTGQKVRFIIKGDQVTVFRDVTVNDAFGCLKPLISRVKPVDMDEAREIYSQALADEYRRELEESWND